MRGINGVGPVKIFNVAEVNGAFYDVVKRASCCFADAAHVVKRKFCFVFNVAKLEFAGAEIYRSLPANKQPSIGCNAC